MHTDRHAVYAYIICRILLTAVMCSVRMHISISISILECTRAGALGNKPNEALL